MCRRLRLIFLKDRQLAQMSICIGAARVEIERLLVVPCRAFKIALLKTHGSHNHGDRRVLRQQRPQSGKHLPGLRKPTGIPIDQAGFHEEPDLFPRWIYIPGHECLYFMFSTACNAESWRTFSTVLAVSKARLSCSIFCCNTRY